MEVSGSNIYNFEGSDRANKSYLNSSGHEGWWKATDKGKDIYVSGDLPRDQAEKIKSILSQTLKIDTNMIDVRMTPKLNNTCVVTVSVESVEKARTKSLGVAEQRFTPSMSKEGSQERAAQTIQIREMSELEALMARVELSKDPLGTYFFRMSGSQPGSIVLSMKTPEKVEETIFKKQSDNPLTYVDANGREYHSIEAIKQAAEFLKKRIEENNAKNETIHIRPISSSEAIDELTSARPGTYFFRKSGSQPGAIVLSIKLAEGVKEFLFQKKSDNPLTYVDADGNKFHSIEEIRAVAERIKKTVVES